MSIGNINDGELGNSVRSKLNSVINKFDTNEISSGSFSGSFQGDGSQLTGVTGEWDGNINGNAQITGSLTVTGTITGMGGIGNFSVIANDITIPPNVNMVLYTNIYNDSITINPGINYTISQNSNVTIQLL